MDPVEAYIRGAAVQRNIDPDQAVRVAASEGLHSYTGDNNSSFGPFQLHYGNVAPGGNRVSGLGDDFTRQTGLNARDPNTVHEQVDFALDHAAQNGWGAWHGWKGDPWAGINGKPSPQFSMTASAGAPLADASAPTSSVPSLAGASAQPNQAAAQPSQDAAPPIQDPEEPQLQPAPWMQLPPPISKLRAAMARMSGQPLGPAFPSPVAQNLVNALGQQS